MHGLLRRVALRAAAAVAAVAVLGPVAAETLAKRYDDPGLVASGLDMSYSGRPFTGIVYEMHGRSWRPYRVMPFYKGQRVGTEIHWYADGGRWIERRYSEGLPHGESRGWYPDGRVKFVESYDRGERHGDSWAWHGNGQVSDFSRYERDKEIARKSWTFDGKPFYNYVHHRGARIGMQGGDFCKSKRSPAFEN